MGAVSTRLPDSVDANITTTSMETSIAWLLLTASACQALPQYPPSTTTPPPPPKPFKYAFAAGRVPGGPPDRYIQSEGDSRGVIRGGFAYLDPNFQWQQVEYVADENGFHVDSANPVSHPQDTAAVAKAKAAHQALFEQIALRNSEVPVVQPNAETPAVQVIEMLSINSLRRLLPSMLELLRNMS